MESHTMAAMNTRICYIKLCRLLRFPDKMSKFLNL
uniref:Uncharacterized protein n=1 Tax=Arundo donax TaxID=35708 RepID=A0A0A9FN29_ARUDO